MVSFLLRQEKYKWRKSRYWTVKFVYASDASFAK